MYIIKIVTKPYLLENVSPISDTVFTADQGWQNPDHENFNKKSRIQLLFKICFH